MSSQSFPIIGALGGAVIGSAIGGPGGALKGLQIGATVGSLVSGFTARPSAVGDAHFPSVTYGTPIPYAWAPFGVAVDCAIIWVELNSNGSYLQDNGGPGKGKQSGDHYSATFAVLIKQSGITFPDGTQVERPCTISRIWMADKIVYQNSKATPINGWSSSTTYNYGDYVTGSDGNVYFSLDNTNLNHDPTADDQSNPVYWKLASTWNTNISFTEHPQIGESTFTMAADSTMVGSLGVAECPAHRGCHYFVVQNLDLYDLGNQIPQMIKVEIADGAPAWSSTVTYQKNAFAEGSDGNLYISLQAGNHANNPTSAPLWWQEVAPLTYADIFSDECRLAGLQPSDVDFSAAAVVPPPAWSAGSSYAYGEYATGSDGQYYLSIANANQANDPTATANQGVWWQAGMFPQPLTGAVRNQRMNAQQAVSNMMLLNAWDLAPIDGVLKLVQRGGEPAVSIPLGDLSACKANGV